MNLPELRIKAREAISSGRLPSRAQDRTLGGTGSDVPCALCDELIQPAMTELEIEFLDEGATLGVDRYCLHHRCFAAWTLEQRELERTKLPT